LVALPDAEERAIDAVLQPGEMSIHHCLTVHGSDPNRSDSDRIGMTMTFLRTDVRSRKGKDFATLVRGQDRFGNFEHAPVPAADLDAAAVAAHARASQRRRELIYATG